MKPVARPRVRMGLGTGSITTARFPLLGIAVALAVLLSACGEEDAPDTRRFANERPPTIASSTATAAIQGTTTPVPAAPPTSSPGALLATRGAPERLYVSGPSELWTIGAVGSDGSNPQPILLLDAEQGEIRSTAQAPGVDGSEIAALIARSEGEGETARLIFLDRDGHVVRRIDRLEAVLRDPAPAGATATAVTWSPQGDMLLVTFSGGGIVAIPTDGEPSLLLPADTANVVEDASWSPAGDAIAYLVGEPGAADPAARRLVVAAVAGGAVDPTQSTVVSRPGDAVGAYAWLPDGSGLLYTDTGAIGGTAGGDLFSVRDDGSDVRLVASAGRAAPVAQIIDFAVSPDGNALAYTIATPDSSGERLVFHSLWLRALDTNETVPVPIPNDATVAQLWWTSDGLVWQSEPVASDVDGSPATAGFTIERLGEDSQRAVLFASTPAATPVADPSGSPVASPATPAASPVASPIVPEATPNVTGSPAASALGQ